MFTAIAPTSLSLTPASKEFTVANGEEVANKSPPDVIILIDTQSDGQTLVIHHLN